MSDHEPDTQQDPFPVDCLPGPLASFVSTVAASIGCDPSFVALPVLSVCGAAIGTTTRLRRKYGYDIPTNIWSIVIGESGTGKSPAFSHAMKPLKRLQNLSLRQHAAEMDGHRSALAMHKKKMDRWLRAGDDSVKPPVEPRPPVARSYHAENVTMAAVVQLLADNPRGILVAVDESSGWFGGFNQHDSGKGSDAAQYLGLFGVETLTIDRKEGGVTSIPNAAISFIGGMQPGILSETIHHKHRKTGMSARFLKAMPPRKARRANTPGVDPAIEAKYSRLVEDLTWIEFNGEDEDGTPLPHFVTLSEEADRRYIAFVEKNREEQASLIGEMAAAWDKLEQYAAWIALVFHYVVAADAGDAAVAHTSQISKEVMESSICLVEWLKREAVRVHEMFAQAADSGGVLTESKVVEIIRGKGGRVTAKELRDACRSIRGDGVAEGWMRKLADSGHGIIEPTGKGKSIRFVLMT